MIPTNPCVLATTARYRANPWSVAIWTCFVGELTRSTGARITGGGARWNQLRVEAAVLAPRDHGRTVHDGMRPGQEEGSYPRAAVATIMKPGRDAGMTR
jgi:hypothetical protein